MVVADTVTGAKHEESKSLYAPKNYRLNRYVIPSPRNPEAGKYVSFTEAFRFYNDHPSLRKQFVYQCLGAIDQNYLDYLNRVATGRAKVDTIVDITSAGLSAAATMVTPVSTKTVLSGLDTFLKGSKTSYQQNFFAALSIFQQLPKMNEGRESVKGKIETMLGGNFTMLSATNRLDELYFAGTIFGISGGS